VTPNRSPLNCSAVPLPWPCSAIPVPAARRRCGGSSGPQALRRPTTAGSVNGWVIPRSGCYDWRLISPPPRISIPSTWCCWWPLPPLLPIRPPCPYSASPGLMTKREVRIQLLADLDLPTEGVLWDVGAGVGSVGLEALRLRPALSLWAVERRAGAAALLAANAARLGVEPAGLVEAAAPAALAQLPDPDRVLIGGGGRERRAVLEAVLQRLRPAGVVVLPLATVEALAELRPLLEAAALAVRVGQLQAWRGAPLGDGTRLAPLNPVLVLSGRRL